jgi:hypothetical protein
MIYRPQYAYGTPPGYRDEQFHYAFDQSNVPALSKGNLAAAALSQNIPLPLQQDAAFIWRALECEGINNADPVVAVRFRDPYGNYLSDDFVPLDLYVRSPGLVVAGDLPVIWEPAIECPAGGIIWLDIKNQSAGNVNLNLLHFTFYGVKRYPIGRVA